MESVPSCIASKQPVSAGLRGLKSWALGGRDCGGQGVAGGGELSGLCMLGSYCGHGQPYPAGRSVHRLQEWLLIEERLDKTSSVCHRHCSPPPLSAQWGLRGETISPSADFAPTESWVGTQSQSSSTSTARCSSPMTVQSSSVSE